MHTALLILPNFALIVVGLVLARRFAFGRDFWNGLEKLVYYALFPALLFRSLATAKIDFAAAAGPIGTALAFTLAGLAWNAAGLPLPGFADQTLNLLGSMALPAGLLSVGAAMRIERGQGPAAAHAWWLAVKLVAVPAVAWLLARALGLSGVE